MEKKKVLFVIHQLNHGGVQKALLSALDAVDYTENEVTLYVRKNRIQLLPEINENVHKIIINEDETHYYRKPYAATMLLCKKIVDILKLKNLSEFFQKKLVDYINQSQMEYEKKHYFNKQETYDVAVSYIQGYTAKFVAQYIDAKKKVMFYHGSTDETHELHEEIMAYYDSIVGVNENVQKILAELYPTYSQKMTFVENYVDVDAVCKKSKEFMIEKPQGTTVLCSCGRLTPVKGFDLAVKAASILKEKGISFLWYFVGDGPERTKLEQMIEAYGLQENIQITGMKDNPYPYINACDIYVQSSYEESFGLTIAEAKILNKPIVTTKTVGGNIQIEHLYNGLVAEIDEKSIAEAIMKYINQEKIRDNVVKHLEGFEYSNIYRRIQLQWEELLKE